MRIVGCDLHARQQMLAMLDTTTGVVVNTTLKHEGSMVREFYANLPRPARVGLEATGSMQWFVSLMEELRIKCLVGHPAEIRAAEPRKQKRDRRDADLLLSLLFEGRFPAIWLPTKELLDLRALLRHRHPWVGLRVKIRGCTAGHGIGAWPPTRFLSVEASRPTRDRVFTLSPHCCLSAERAAGDVREI